MTTLVVYHQGCADGSFAAAITALAYPNDTIHFLPAVYAQDQGDIVTADYVRIEDIPGLEGGKDALYKRVVVVDFSLSERQMALFTSRYHGNFKVLDHHDCRDAALYAKECAALDVSPSQLTFAAGGSGALLAYMAHVSDFQQHQYACTDNIIRIAQLVSDRDLWIRTNKRAFAFYEGYVDTVFKEVEKCGHIYTEMPPTVRAAHKIILTGNVEEIIEQGFKNIEIRDEKIRQMIADNSYFSEPNHLVPVKHAVVPCDKGIASETGTYVYENYHHFQTVLLVRKGHRDPDRVYVSCRSRGYSDGDAGSARAIARAQGGDGHVNAAGFNVALSEFNELYPGLKLDFDSVGCDC
ncbi:hypothetical protein pEaSNUABM40_00162 [Erwinia phage pEa_SNUABM_40]|uniref:Uncharacterized protein n=1 Tax=Erwinia phage pEa_SNUABM_3 TaxID=2869552 RepID=A0AAE7XIW1_9CAUD|nr:DHH phosphoesterase [Erwinia phage pEa_SNUABM_3]QZE56358.1 hypothetical protein pEaSNUABM3_00161 [Erwinia phage pEa_SNUABM_3]QZE56697.1 hypothetical protein pEaSNUABM20_00161 [Erwinia phage pEa_SNUABM_20]QZE58378.1 hypothetical protein pEaSNUABM40_00162 [Erwinia phage pEa_SNUABM_40]